VSGRIADNVAIKNVKLEFHKILNLDGTQSVANTPATHLEVTLSNDQIITQALDVSSLDEGVYNFRIRVTDKADNQALATRTVTLTKKKKQDTLDLMFPLKGETVSGEFTVQGAARSEHKVESAEVFIDGKSVGSCPVNLDGFFSLPIKSEDLSDGTHDVSARFTAESGDVVTSVPITILYKQNGPWISIDTFHYGEYLPSRPYLKGKAGWRDDTLSEMDKKTQAKLQAQRVVQSVDISMDNGKTFLPASGAASWKFRLETQDYREGDLFIIMRATYANGDKAYAKTIFNLDKTPPTIKLLAPVENERLNQNVTVIGTASDETDMGEVKVLLRKGDKAGYSVPSFIQGLFFDAHFFGATAYEVGAGLTFFDDNVKLMGSYGWAEPGKRYGGNIYGVKLLANIYYLPFSYLLGPDWDFLQANFAVGAGFSYFTDTGSGNPQTLGMVIAQLEFPKITMPILPVFRKLSFYTEGRVWFVTSDIAGTVEFSMAIGARSNLF
jgi:hypothetical protein